MGFDLGFGYWFFFGGGGGCVVYQTEQLQKCGSFSCRTSSTS